MPRRRRAVQPQKSLLQLRDRDGIFARPERPGLEALKTMDQDGDELRLRDAIRPHFAHAAILEFQMGFGVTMDQLVMVVRATIAGIICGEDGEKPGILVARHHVLGDRGHVNIPFRVNFSGG